MRRRNFFGILIGAPLVKLIEPEKAGKVLTERYPMPKFYTGAMIGENVAEVIIPSKTVRARNLIPSEPRLYENSCVTFQSAGK